MNNPRLLFLGLLISSVLLASCGGADIGPHASNSGLIPEVYIPNDVGMLASYSSRDDEQFAAIQAIEKTLGQTDSISSTASGALDTQFGAVGLDFERDLKPAFGDQFRMVNAVRPGIDETPENFTIVTLENPDQMKSVLQTLVDAKQMTYKKLSDIDVYVDEESKNYVTINEDLLFVATTPENLVGMVEQNEDESLWGSDAYQKTVEDLGSNYVFYGVLYPALYTSDVSLLSGFSVSDVPSVVDQQVVVVRAAENGFTFSAWMNANEDKAKEAGIAFDSVPRSEAYLFKEIPSAGLMAYFESYGLQQTLEQADKLGDDTSTLESLREMARTYFGMDLDADILSFLDKGYSIVLQKNGEGVMPGITIYVDVSSNVDGAQSFMDKLDGQLTGLLMALQTTLPGVVTKDTVTWAGETFNRISVDLSAVPQAVESPLPAAVTASTIQLVYGVKGERLFISTAADWKTDATNISDSDLYKKLSAKTSDVSEGLILVDAKGVADFVAALRALREQMGLEVSEEAITIENLLQGFLGGIAMSETKAYESRFEGFLMLAE